MADHHTIVSHDQWFEARIALLAKQKQFTRLPDRRCSEGVPSVEPSAHRVTNFVLSSDASKI
jgi:hypothetical protein